MVGEATFERCIGCFCHKQHRPLPCLAELQLPTLSWLCLHWSTATCMANYAIITFRYALAAQQLHSAGPRTEHNVTRRIFHRWFLAGHETKVYRAKHFGFIPVCPGNHEICNSGSPWLGFHCRLFINTRGNSVSQTFINHKVKKMFMDAFPWLPELSVENKDSQDMLGFQNAKKISLFIISVVCDIHSCVPTWMLRKTFKFASYRYKNKIRACSKKKGKALNWVLTQDLTATNLEESLSELQLPQFWSSLQQHQCTGFSSYDPSAIGYTVPCWQWQSHMLPHWHEVAPAICWCKIKIACINNVVEINLEEMGSINC